MSARYRQEYCQIFEYLRSPQEPTEAAPVLGFGRNDPRIAHETGKLVVANLADIVVFSGGFGKDSGNLEARGFHSEAHYQEKELAKYTRPRKLVLPRVILEEQATNGAENARLGLPVIHAARPDATALILVAHATSMLRLTAVTEKESLKAAHPFTTFSRVPTEYPFNPDNSLDRQEALAELLRVAEWPDKDWAVAQRDLPLGLLDFAYEQDPSAPR